MFFKSVLGCSKSTSLCRFFDLSNLLHTSLFLLRVEFAYILGSDPGRIVPGRNTDNVSRTGSFYGFCLLFIVHLMFMIVHRSG